jgi:hypothetical protein
VLWARRCQGVPESVAAAFLATQPPADLVQLADDLEALAAALPGFRGQIPAAELLWPVAGLRASVRGLGPLIHWLRRCAGADETLASLFLGAHHYRPQLELLADQLRGLRYALHAFRDRPARVRPQRARPVDDVPARAMATAADDVNLGTLPWSAVVPPERADPAPVPVDLDALISDDAAARSAVAPFEHWASERAPESDVVHPWDRPFPLHP